MSIQSQTLSARFHGCGVSLFARRLNADWLLPPCWSLQLGCHLRGGKALATAAARAMSRLTTTSMTSVAALSEALRMNTMLTAGPEAFT